MASGEGREMVMQALETTWMRRRTLIRGSESGYISQTAAPESWQEAYLIISNILYTILAVEPPYHNPFLSPTYHTSTAHHRRRHVLGLVIYNIPHNRGDAGGPPSRLAIVVSRNALLSRLSLTR
jgi:hypothetical protein